MEFLKDVLGEELYGKVAEKLKGNDKIKLANLADGGYVGKEKFDSAQTTINDLKAQLTQRDTDITNLKKSAGNSETLTKQLTDLQTKYKSDTDSLNAKLSSQALNYAIDMGITKANGKNAKAIKALVDMSKLKLKDDSTVDGLEDALNAVKESDPYLFTVTETKPQGNKFNNGGVPGGGGDTACEKEVADAFASARNNY